MDLSLRMDKAKIRVLDKVVDMLGLASSYDKFLGFERKTSFIYTRIKGKASLGYMPNLTEPRSFNEKSIHRRLFSRNAIWPVVTDKVQVRNWLTEQGLDQGYDLVPMPYVIDDVDQFDFNQIDEPVVIKAAWASGLNLFVKEPLQNDWESIRAKMKKWQQIEYFPKRLVWPETQMKRVYAVEKMYSNSPGGMLDDYKFYVFHGQVELLQVISGRGADLTYDHYDRNLRRLPQVSRRGKKSGQGKLAQQVEAMIPLVERIGEKFDFARVDMYLLDGRIMFGEITQCPANGFASFNPTRFDFELGEKWQYDHKAVYESFINTRSRSAACEGVVAETRS